MPGWTQLPSVAVLLLVSSAFARTQDYELTITNKNLAPDGLEKQSIAVNGGVQGPLITANLHDTLNVNVVNRNTIGPPVMLKSTSIHWHGLFQHRTADEDGVAFVSQCPIPAGNHFNYKLPLNGQSGTYWYHSHLGTQYCDGLRGPLVIYDPNDPLRYLYDIDNADTVLTLADWYIEPSLQSFPPVPAGQNRGLSPPPISHLINGKGRRQDSGINSPLSVVTVQRGKRYRFRLMNMACDGRYNFWIQDHKMTIIEADGVLHQPHEVDTLQIFDGQRYSFVLQADRPIDNYWIRLVPNDLPANFTGGINSAILRYKGAIPMDPDMKKGLKPGSNALREQDLRPLLNPGAPHGNVQKIELDILPDLATGSFKVNNVSFVSPSVPVLLQILKGARPQDLLPKGSIYELERNKVIEVTFRAAGPGAPHPIHLHGHTFDVIRSAGQNNTNLVNPPRRDVVNTGNGDAVTIRFNTDNPGPWILHCHIDWHLDAGLAIIFAERTDEIVAGNQSSHFDGQDQALCDAYNKLQPSDL